jgi:hypothetical protein
MYDEIWVAKGTYKPTTLSRSKSFDLRDGVRIYGGFSDAGHPDWGERKPDAYETILSGDIGVEGDDSDNSYHVLYAAGATEITFLDGFTITKGRALEYGHTRGAGILMRGVGPTISNCTFVDNAAGEGGGAIIQGHPSTPTTSTFTNCRFLGNSAAYGAGVRAYDGTPRFINCLFSGNHATIRAGGLDSGGRCEPVLINCTFSANSAEAEGGGISHSGGTATAPDSISLDNCILWDNSDEGGKDYSAQIHDEGATAVIEYSCVQDGSSLGPSNIFTPPHFMDPDGPDDIPGTADDDLRLSLCSLCIDAGDDTAVPAGVATDLEGFPRFANGDCDGAATVDMGAYESHAYIGDFDDNCKMDYLDVEMFAAAWATRSGDPHWNPACDISNPPDDVIDFLDLAVLGDYWSYWREWSNGYELDASVVAGHGSISPTGGTYDSCTVVALTATPDNGYQVKTWTGTDNDDSTETTNTVTMISDKAVSVEYEPNAVATWSGTWTSGPNEGVKFTWMLLTDNAMTGSWKEDLMRFGLLETATVTVDGTYTEGQFGTVSISATGMTHVGLYRVGIVLAANGVKKLGNTATGESDVDYYIYKGSTLIDEAHDHDETWTATVVE